MYEKSAELTSEQKVRLTVLKNTGAYVEWEPWMAEKPIDDMTDEELDKMTCYMADNYYVMNGRSFCDDLWEVAECVVATEVDKENRGRRKIHKKRRKRRNR